MAGLAYLFLPLTGLAAYMKGRDARTRFHGLQAILFGFLWTVALFGCSEVSPLATVVCFGIGGLVWLGLMIPAFFGKDVRLPLVGRLLQRASLEPPGGEVPLEG